MRLETEQEFKQRKIFEFNKKLTGWKSFCSRTKYSRTEKNFIKKEMYGKI